MNRKMTIVTDSQFEKLMNKLDISLSSLNFDTIQDFDATDASIDSQGYIQSTVDNKLTIRYLIRNRNQLVFDAYKDNLDVGQITKQYHMSVKSIEAIVASEFSPADFQNMTYEGLIIVKTLMKKTCPKDYKQLFGGTAMRVTDCDDSLTRTLAVTWDVNNQQFVVYWNRNNVASLAITCALTLLARSPIIGQYLVDPDSYSDLKYMFDVLINYSLVYLFLHELSHVQYRDIVNNEKILRDSLGGQGWESAGMDNMLEDSYINDRLNLRIGGMSEVSNVLSKLNVANFDLAIGVSGRLTNDYYFNRDVSGQSSSNALDRYLSSFQFDTKNVEVLFNFIKRINVKKPVTISALNMNCAKGTYAEFIKPYANLVQALSDLDKPIKKRHLVFSPPSNKSNKSDSQSGNSKKSSDAPSKGILKPNGSLYSVNDKNEETYHIYGPRED